MYKTAEINQLVIGGHTKSLAKYRKLQNVGRFLAYQCIKDRVIPMFTKCRQNQSHIAACVGQALLYSRQPRCDGCYIRDNLHPMFDIMTLKLSDDVGFLCLQPWLIQQRFKISMVYSSVIC